MSMGMNNFMTFNQMLARKYQIQGQQADAATKAADAGMMGAETDRMGMPSTVNLRQAQTAGQQLNNQFAPQLFESTLAGEAADTRQTSALARGTEMDNNVNRAFNLGLLGDMFPTASAPRTGGGPGMSGARNRIGFAGLSPMGRGLPSIGEGLSTGLDRSITDAERRR